MSQGVRHGGGGGHGNPDMGAAFLGLFAALIVVLAVVYSIVRLTDASFEGHEPAPAAAATPH
jgi:hypothetical protein